MKYSIKDKVLAINGKEVKFLWPISKVEDFENCLVVLIEPKPGEKYNENVFGISSAGEFLWQINSSRHIREDSPYTSITKKDDLIAAYNWSGMLYWLDPKTGKIVKEEYIK